ncbi:MAG TPA: T9SS type A sorting domain-containing protein, partial [Nitrosopumilaceae archaeon]|nr:T9SS type A sorting domain-containing protein [Nitrosopumilaceae archaeon]
NLYISDNYNNRIRKVTLSTGIQEYPNPGNVNVFPIPCNGILTADLSGKGYNSIKISDILGREVYRRYLDAEQQNMNIQVNISEVPDGVYMMQVNTMEGIVNRRILVQR